MKKVKITQVKSAIGATKRQKLTLEALGLKKREAQREHTLSPEVKGMIDKVSHLILVEEI